MPDIREIIEIVLHTCICSLPFIIISLYSIHASGRNESTVAENCHTEIFPIFRRYKNFSTDVFLLITFIGSFLLLLYMEILSRCLPE
jgi:hypothetical protein